MQRADFQGLYREHVAELERAYGAALAAHGYDAVVIHSGTAKKRSEYDDQYWPVRPTPHFQHWTPIRDGGCFVVVEPGKKTILVWPEHHDFWERPAPPESLHFAEVLDVRRTIAAREAVRGRSRVAWIGEDLPLAESLTFGETNPPALLATLDALRTKKTPYEIECLAEANRRACRGHEALRQAFAEGACAELDLHLLYLAATRQDDPETPYKNIVAMGGNAAILHHIAYGRDATRAESLLVDAGATCFGYCSDITRTWVKRAGTASQTFFALVMAMEAMQRRMVDKIAHDAPYEDLHDESHRQVSAILKESGLAHGSVDEIDASGVSRTFYPHGLGHSLGLQTHDVGCASTKPQEKNPFLRNTSKIETGQVFTIEPGLYFIDALLGELRAKPAGKLVDWSLVDVLAPLGGIRIEDDVLVTPHGTRNFTREVLPQGGGAA